MPTKYLITQMDGTPKQIVFGDHAGDFAPTTANDLRITTDGSNELDAQLTLASLANGAARQSAKVDLGTDWADQYNVRAAFEFAATPTAGNAVELYFGFSPHATAANGNPGNLTGSDAAYSGYATNLDASIKHLYGPLIFSCTADATTTVQVAECGILVPLERYLIIVVKNESGAAFHSDDVESHIVLDPIVTEFQN